jgi:hypothetical protein
LETGAAATIMGSDERGVMVRHKTGRLTMQSWNTFRRYWSNPAICRLCDGTGKWNGFRCPDCSPPNAKLTDDEERAKDARIGTCG